MTNAMIVRSLQSLTVNMRNIWYGFFATTPRNLIHRGVLPPPSVIKVCNRPIAFDPLP